ncbi:MAG: Hsp20/alpha crystallin family protein [Patescibacteria group bacterium]|nr:Hsp20/alpha crystallin family protein [Patescibacteria group bacterium]MDD5164137.1 Hsp20/alpha crystallin family protein [Patescibacteria group bacterium]MDD5534205.1 Hsp20/alpha crystallin family protein [Patescibacteria group bacterium]
MTKIIWSKITGLPKDVLEKETEEVNTTSEAPIKKKVKEKKPFMAKKKPEESEIKKWLPDSGQGQLVVDIFERDNNIIVESTIAGINKEDIDITVESDLIVIRGERRQETEDETKNYYLQECFWGKFSRTLVLPYPVKSDKVKANLKNGILTVILPKTEDKDQNIEVE